MKATGPGRAHGLRLEPSPDSKFGRARPVLIRQARESLHPDAHFTRPAAPDSGTRLLHAAAYVAAEPARDVPAAAKTGRPLV